MGVPVSPQCVRVASPARAATVLSVSQSGSVSHRGRTADRRTDNISDF